jgi:hypothetical protein
MEDVSPNHDKGPSRPKPKPELGFLDVDTPDDFFEPMTEEELTEWE